jgi:hypothetical protein
MPATTAHGATFTFSGFSGLVTGLSVQTPTAEVVEMSSMTSGSGQIMLVPTGAWTGGEMTVECLGLGDPQGLVRNVGVATFASQNLTVTRRVVCESASVEARAGELVRATLKLRFTDYVG